ncbi:MAG: HTTM domain-containing protein [Myxococcales bacterium]|nr:HTTM domain-containing protein [Myxococcales bacterium]
MWSFVKERWGTLDTRTLALFRIGFGLLMITNLLDRTGFVGDDLVSFYSNEGIWPNHYALFLPPTPGYWSLLSGFSSPNEVRVAMLVIFAIYVLYTLGWKTRLMQVLALLCVESVNFRFLLPQHGGTVVMNILAVWTVFLPLGDRFSLDALFSSLRYHQGATPETLSARAWTKDQVSTRTGLAIFGVFFNYAVIYFFNTVHKQAGAWLDGSAVHYLLWQNRMATTLAEVVRMHEPGFLSPVLSWGTLFVEGSLVVLLLTPFLQEKLRPLALVFIWSLHGGIALLTTLGPFSYSMMCFALLCTTPAMWAWLERRWAVRPRVTVRYDDASELHRFGVRLAARLDLGRVLDFEVTPGARLGPAELKQIVAVLPGWRWLGWLMSTPTGFSFVRWLALLLAGRLTATVKPAPRPVFIEQGAWLVRIIGPALVLAAVISQMLMENWAVPQQLKPATRPDWMTDIINYLQVPQGWSMFAPDVPKQDTRLVVDATLADGTHVDPLTGAPPDFETLEHGPWFMNQHWCEVHARMPNWRHHWRNFREYLYRRPRALGWPVEKNVVAIQVFKVSGDMPAPGSTTPTNVKKELLFADEPM